MNFEIIINEFIKFFLLLFFLLINISDKQKLKNIRKKIRITGDVLYANGCYPDIFPDSYRYRILNQIEQLNAG